MFTLNLRQPTRSYWIAMGLLLLIGAAWLCRPQTSASAQGVEQSFFEPHSWAREMTYNHRWKDENPRLLADVNGDGKQDVVGFGDAGVWQATSDGWNFSPGFVLAQFGYQQSWRVAKHVRTVGDINGDRMEDIVGFGDDGVWTALATGNGFAPAQFVLTGFGNLAGGWRVDRHPRLLADVNGDGQKDIVAFGDAGVWIALATGAGGFSDPAFVVGEFGFNQGWTLTNHVRTTADVNGDGMQDIVGFADDGVYVAFATGGGGFGPAHRALAEFGYYAGGWRVERHVRLLVDIDRDGMQDIVAFGDDGVWVARSNGSGFEAPKFVLANFGYNQGWRVGKHPRFVTDLNGDGYQDIVGYGEESVYRALGGPGGFGDMWMILRALVAGQGPDYFSADFFGKPDLFPRLVGDVTGDGKADLVAFEDADIKVAVSNSYPPPPAPAAPSNPRITARTETTLTLAWGDNSDNERRFIIRWRKIGDGYQKFYVGANVTSFVFSELDPNTQYCFRVQAENLWGLSEETTFECARTSPKPTPPPPPPPAPERGFSSVHVFNCHFQSRPVHIWTRDVTQSFWVERGIAPSQWNSLGSCPGSSAPFMFTLEPGRRFWVKAVDPQFPGCNGQNDPENGACVKSYFPGPLLGDAKGTTLQVYIN